MSPPIFFAPFFIKHSFPLYSQKYFSCPTTPPQPFSCHPSTLTLFFSSPFPLSKKLPSFNAFKQNFFLSHKRIIILACSNYGRSTSISFLEAGDPTS
ncbi:hypothetical protein INQ98_01895 [Chlamydia suis]|nr:hypothetical protein INQ98_01895 [Chlamydia suis]